MNAFEVIQADFETPFIASIPHSGLIVPDHAAKYFSEEHARSLANTDWYLDSLYGFLPKMGISLIKNHIYRYVIDVNRPLTEPYIGDFWRAIIPDAIPDSVPHNWNLYRSLPDSFEVEKRIQEYYKPFHSALKSEVEKKKRRHDKVYLIDLHSFIGGMVEDICIGDLNGRTSCPELKTRLRIELEKSRFNVAQDQRFPGGFITKNYFEHNKVYTCQIEIRAGMYLDSSELDQGRPPRILKPKFDEAGAGLEKAFKNAVQATLGASAARSDSSSAIA